MIRLPSPPTAEDDDWERTRPLSGAASADSALEGALRSMRLAPPPAADNGGAFEAPADAFGGVSPAAANAASAQHGPLDPVLVSCLENPRERLSMLKFEDQIVRFLRNPRESQLSFPPLSSYHRLIIHRLAQRCFLDHQTGDYNPYAPTYDGNSARVVTLFKTSQSAVPAVLLINLSSDRQQPAVTPASAPRIMVRKRNVQRPGTNGGRGAIGAKDNSKATRSMQDRERAYAEARARIFGEDSAADSSSATSPNGPSSTAAKAAVSASNSASNSGADQGRNRQASGPDGSKGFDRGRVSPQGRSQIDNKNGGRGAGQGPQRAARSPVTDPQSWKESKVLWRNREQELNDPDFTRNHGAYRPIRTTNTNTDGLYQHSPLQQPQQRYGSGGGGYGGRYGGEYSPQQYDRSQQGFTSPQFQAGSGRGRYSSEYSRVDGPPQFYRGGPHQMAPPPPVAVARGFTGTYIQERSPSRSPPAMSAGTQQGQSGGYNDDFPPLGR